MNNAEDVRPPGVAEMIAVHGHQESPGLLETLLATMERQRDTSRIHADLIRMLTDRVAALEAHIDGSGSDDAAH